MTGNTVGGMSLFYRSISEQPQSRLESSMTDSGADAAVNLLAVIGTIWIICGKSTVSKRSLTHDQIFITEGHRLAHER